ncbi:hypothetical protein RyT2_10310 [Pseudolactococcus yaeyamensis]
MLEKIVKEKMQTKSRQIKSQEIIFTLVMILLAYLAIKLFMAASGGLLLAILTIFFCASILVYLKAKKLKLTKTQWLYLAYVLLLSLAITLTENKILQSVNLWQLAISLTYWLLVLLGARRNGCLDYHIVYDFWDSLVIRTARFERREGLELATLNGQVKAGLNFRSSHLFKIMIGLAISAPLLLLVMVLLVNADAVFATMVITLFSFSLGVTVENTLILLAAICIGLYIGRLINQNLKSKPIPHSPIKPLGHANLVFMTIISVFVLIYALFLSASIITCLKLTAKTVDYQVVEAARNGFFQLLIVALINVAMFLIVKVLSEKNKQIQVGLTLIGLETLGIIISALVKMLLYISSFGLTILRFNTSIFMMILFVCVTIFISALWRDYNYTRLTTAFVAFCILGLSFINSGNLIAQYNFQQFSTGKITEFDADILDKIGVEAVPTAYDIYQKTDNIVLKNQVKRYLINTQNEMANQKMMITVQRLQADKQIKRALD